MRSLPPGGDTRSIDVREAAVLDAVRAGGALPIVWSPIHTEIPGHKATVYVASDTLRFGEPGANLDPGDWDWVRVAVTAETAQRIADALGVLLPTDRIADLVHAQATVRLTPHWQQPVTATTDAMLRHHADIEAERAGRDGLLSTIGKDWILGRELFPTSPGGLPAHPLGWDGAINYGWHTRGPATRNGPYVGQPGVVLWQTKGFRHNRRHIDYAQWVPRFVHPRMEVDGRWVRTADVMTSPELAGLVTYDGPLPDVRYPHRLRAEEHVMTGQTDQRPDGGVETGSADPFLALNAEAGAPTPSASAEADPWASFADAGSSSFGPLEIEAETLERARQRQRAWLKTTWVRDTWLGRFLRLDAPPPPSEPGIKLDPAPAHPPLVLRPEPDAGAPLDELSARSPTDIDTQRDADAGAPPGWAPGAALAQLLQQIDTRFPFRGKGLLDGLGEDDVLRVTDDASRNGPYRSGPELRALSTAVLADRRGLRTEYVYDAARTHYLAVVARSAPACSQDPSLWDLSRLDSAAPSPVGDAGKTDAGTTDAGSIQADQAGQGAKAGAAIGGTVGTALEAVPVAGPFLHAIAAAVGAIGGAIGGALKDTFHPTALQAAAWLVLFHIDPGFVFSGVDTITTQTGDRRHPAEEHAARLVRYFLLVSGFVHNHGELYNPNDIRNDNPYMARVDPRFPLTNPRHLRTIKHRLEARLPVRSEVSTPAQARMMLALLRKALGPSGIMGWSEAQAHLGVLRDAVKRVRALAGEVGPDHALARLLGGDVTPRSRPVRHVYREHERRLLQPLAGRVHRAREIADPFAEIPRHHRRALERPLSPLDTDPFAALRAGRRAIDRSESDAGAVGDPSVSADDPFADVNAVNSHGGGA
jgi:hypothetical protein